MIRSTIACSNIFVSDIDAHSTTRLQYSEAFAPNLPEFFDVCWESIAITDLARTAIILDIPIRRRSNDQVNTLILDLTHVARVVAKEQSMGCGKTLWLGLNGTYDSQVAVVHAKI